jgi:hypothetical protein
LILERFMTRALKVHTRISAYNFTISLFRDHNLTRFRHKKSLN